MSDKIFRLALTQDIHNAVKVTAAKQNRTMQSLLEQFVEFGLYCEAKQEQEKSENCSFKQHEQHEHN